MEDSAQIISEYLKLFLRCLKISEEILFEKRLRKRLFM